MEYLDKIKRITSNIKKIYEKLIDMENYGLTNSSVYQKNLELLKLSKELEDKYYKELETLSKEQIYDLTKKINIDNYACKDKNDITCAFENALYNNCDIEKRRIYMRLFEIFVKKQDDKKIFETIYQDNTQIDDISKLIQINGKDILILNRSYEFLQITNRATDNLSLKYIFFIQLYIIVGYFPNLFIKNKYDLIFTNQYIEDKMLENNFKMDLKFINNIREKEISENNQDVYDYYIEIYSFDLLNSVIEEFQYITNDEYTEGNLELIVCSLYYEALIRTSCLEIDETTLEEIKYELDNIPNEQTDKSRKKIIDIIEGTKKDKEKLLIK